MQNLYFREGTEVAVGAVFTHPARPLSMEVISARSGVLSCHCQDATDQIEEFQMEYVYFLLHPHSIVRFDQTQGTVVSSNEFVAYTASTLALCSMLNVHHDQVAQRGREIEIILHSTVEGIDEEVFGLSWRIIFRRTLTLLQYLLWHENSSTYSVSSIAYCLARSPFPSAVCAAKWLDMGGPLSFFSDAPVQTQGLCKDNLGSTTSSSTNSEVAMSTVPATPTPCATTIASNTDFALDQRIENLKRLFGASNSVGAITVVSAPALIPVAKVDLQPIHILKKLAVDETLFEVSNNAFNAFESFEKKPEPMILEGISMTDDWIDCVVIPLVNVMHKSKRSFFRTFRRD